MLSYKLFTQADKLELNKKLHSCLQHVVPSIEPIQEQNRSIFMLVTLAVTACQGPWC